METSLREDNCMKNYFAHFLCTMKVNGDEFISLAEAANDLVWNPGFPSSFLLLAVWEEQKGSLGSRLQTTHVGLWGLQKALEVAIDTSELRVKGRQCLHTQQQQLTIVGHLKNWRTDCKGVH